MSELYFLFPVSDVIDIPPTKIIKFLYTSIVWKQGIIDKGFDVYYTLDHSLFYILYLWKHGTKGFLLQLNPP